MIGKEELEIIKPAIEEFKTKSINIEGPISPDVVFREAASGAFDAVVCMYHDQGLIPLKLIDFETGVNVTLGLPIIRTSVDHGTAFEIAGKGVASHHAMLNAIEYAVKLAVTR